MSANYDYLFKFILIGDSSVGKSCLLNRYIQGKFKSQHDPTLGVQFGCKNITIDGLALRLQIWDTAGQQSFKSITRAYYKGSVAAFLVFDITRRCSFDNINKWLFQVKNYSQQNIQIVLIGNKADLSGDRQVTYDEAKKFANQNKYEYFQTSALNGQNVNQPFELLSRKIVLKIQNKQINPEAQNSFGIKVGKKRKQSKTQKPIYLTNDYQKKHISKKSCKC